MGTEKADPEGMGRRVAEIATASLRVDAVAAIIAVCDLSRKDLRRLLKGVDPAEFHRMARELARVAMYLEPGGSSQP